MTSEIVKEGAAFPGSFRNLCENLEISSGEHNPNSKR